LLRLPGILGSMLSQTCEAFSIKQIKQRKELILSGDDVDELTHPAPVTKFNRARHGRK
jgi:hypothetical protein